jgi:hypothetical protein
MWRTIAAVVLGGQAMVRILRGELQSCCVAGGAKPTFCCILAD